MDNLRILVIGAGGHGQVVADILLSQQRQGEAVCPIGYLDDDPGKHGQVLSGLPVLGFIKDRHQETYDALIVAIGNNAVRRDAYQNLLHAGERFVSACHPTATIAAGVTVGQGTMICAGAIINPGARIGNGVILNTGCRIEHHNQIGDYAHIAPGATLGGAVAVGQGVFVGIGASIIPGQHLGEWSTIGAGAVVIRHVEAHDTVAGVPAKSILEGEL